MVLRIMEGQNYDAEDEDTLFPLLIIQSLTLPSQGFFNLLVYIRPSYLRCRKEFPEASYFWCFRRAMYGDRIKPGTQISRRQEVERPSTQFGASQFLHRMRRRMSSIKYSSTGERVRFHSSRATCTGVTGLPNSQLSTGIPTTHQPPQHEPPSVNSFFEDDEAKGEVESSEEIEPSTGESLVDASMSDAGGAKGLNTERRESDQTTNESEASHANSSRTIVQARDSYSDEGMNDTTLQDVVITDKGDQDAATSEG